MRFNKAVEFQRWNGIFVASYRALCIQIRWLCNSVAWYPVDVKLCKYAALKDKFISHICDFLKKAWTFPENSDGQQNARKWSSRMSDIKISKTTWKKGVCPVRWNIWGEFAVFATLSSTFDGTFTLSTRKENKNNKEKGRRVTSQKTETKSVKW